MPYYAVIDTNVIVSALLNNDSIPGIIVSKCYTREIIPVINNEILDEYEDVIKRNKFSFDITKINKIIEFFKNNSLFLDRQKTYEILVDAKDVVFFEVVMSARTSAGAYLVTGNKKHFPIRPFVVTPREMLEIINNQNID